MQSPIASVIIATYNRAHLIRRGIESVLSQSFQDFELIIIDDGSTDDTAEVVASYEDPRVIYHRQEHGERSRARNTGINISRGQYIAFLDSDDWYLPNKLSSQIAALDANPDCGLVLGGWLIVDESGRKILEVCPWEGVSSQPTLEEWLFSATSTPITVLIRKVWLDRVGGFNPDLYMSEDIELWIRLTLSCCRVVWTRESVGVVLAHETNSLRDWSRVKQGRMAYLDVIFSNVQFVKNLKISKQEVYARFHLVLAWLAYDSELINEGKQELNNAINLYPRFCDHENKAILDSIIDYSLYFLVYDSVKFINHVFENLPTRLVHLHEYRRDVLGKVWMSRAWRMRKNQPEDNDSIRRYIIHALWFRPVYFKNRGVLSLLLQTLVGK